MHNGDLLISCRGTTPKIARYENNVPNSLVIASSNLIVIRSKKFESYYLKAFFESPYGFEILMSLQRGGNVININPSDLEEIEIPDISVNLMFSISSKYQEEYNIYKKSIEETKVRWNKIQEEIYNEF